MVVENCGNFSILVGNRWVLDLRTLHNNNTNPKCVKHGHDPRMQTWVYSFARTWASLRAEKSDQVCVLLGPPCSGHSGFWPRWGEIMHHKIITFPQATERDELCEYDFDFPRASHIGFLIRIGRAGGARKSTSIAFVIPPDPRRAASEAVTCRSTPSIVRDIAAPIKARSSPPRPRILTFQVSVLMVGLSYVARNVLSYTRCTGTIVRMSHRKRRETKQQPSRARSSNQISCCFVSLHFLCDILSTG